MSDTPVVVETPDDLDAFETVFYNKAPKQEEVKAEEPVVDETDEAEVETEVEAEEIDDDTVADADDDTEEDPDEDEAEEPKAKGKNRKTAQERIKELTAKAREAERREADVLRKLNDLEARLTPKEEVKVKEADGAPDPNAETADGEALYPLGEFDPKYIRDLTRFTIKGEQEAYEASRKESEAKAEAEATRKQAATVWQERLEKAEETLPDVREKINSLEDMFTGLDAGYGQYLVDVVMSLETGPEILHYLADHPKEAQTIVGSGAASATLALGRLDAKLARVPVTEAPKKVTKAPTPPDRITRGSGGKVTASPDTDDLDAFERQFYKK